MSDKKMSQNQIDELFENDEQDLDQLLLENGDEEEDYQTYDFNRPDKFNMENIRSLQSIANVFSRGFSQIMSASLRIPINFKLNKDNVIEQVPYASEYVEKMVKDYYAFCIIDLGDEKLGKIIVEVDLALALPIHKNLLGAGKDISLHGDRKPLSEIEKDVMEEWVRDKMFPELEDAFQNVAQFHLDLTNIETDPQSPYVKITRGSDMIALIAFDVEIGTHEDKEVKEAGIRICIPYLSIEAIIDKLTTENANEYKLDLAGGDQEEVIKKHLFMVRKKVDIELGKNKISLKELLELAEGDVLPLDRKIDDELIGYVAQKPKFSCVPGRKGNKLAVKIKTWARKEDEE